MNTAAKSEKQQIDYLYAWIHPGYAVSITQHASRSERALLRSIEELARGVCKIRDTAMAIFMQYNKGNFEECLSGKNGPGHKRWSSSVQMVQEMFGDRAVMRYKLLESGHIEDVPGIKTEFEQKGYLLNRETQIIGIGETAGSCVPSAVCDLTRKLRSSHRGIIDCSHTTARNQPFRDSWKEGGTALHIRRQQYKTIDFVPIPDDL